MCHYKLLVWLWVELLTKNKQTPKRKKNANIPAHINWMSRTNMALMLSQYYFFCYEVVVLIFGCFFLGLTSFELCIIILPYWSGSLSLLSQHRDWRVVWSPSVWWLMTLLVTLTERDQQNNQQLLHNSAWARRQPCYCVINTGAHTLRH